MEPLLNCAQHDRATLSLLSATTLLIAPLVRKYQLFPVGEMARWIEQFEFYPEEELPEARERNLQTTCARAAQRKSPPPPACRGRTSGPVTVWTVLLAARIRGNSG